MFYVYILRSIDHPKQTYVSSTSDLRSRLAQHIADKSIHTNKFKPWNLMAYVALPDKLLAETFERYLKTGSGRALASRRLITINASMSAAG